MNFHCQPAHLAPDGPGSTSAGHDADQLDWNRATLCSRCTVTVLQNFQHTVRSVCTVCNYTQSSLHDGSSLLFPTQAPNHDEDAIMAFGLALNS
jgi:ribosomal protein S27AE